MSSSTDAIRRQILINAPRSKVWRALTTAEEFGKWFGVVFASKSFSPGKSIQGKIIIPGYEHVTMDIVVERIDPETFFSWRWHPYAIDSAVDYSKEPTTLVEFDLKEVKEGTLLSVTESGFDKIPVSRRQEAFRMNSGGWDFQVESIKKYVSESATT